MHTTTHCSTRYNTSSKITNWALILVSLEIYNCWNCHIQKSKILLKIQFVGHFYILWIVDDITTFLPPWCFFLFKSKIKLYPPHLSHNFITTFLPPWCFLLFKSKTICFLMVFLDRALIRRPASKPETSYVSQSGTDSLSQNQSKNHKKNNYKNYKNYKNNKIHK